MNIIQLTIQALLNLDDDTYFSDERVYQGGLLCQLNFLWDQRIFPKNKIRIQQERQKNIPAHNLRLRPDIVIHIPTVKGQSTRKDNFCVYALKRAASQKEAMNDFSKLEEFFVKLNYPLGIFININSNNTYLDSYTGEKPERIHAFSVELFAAEIEIHHTYWAKDRFVVDIIRQEIQMDETV